MVILPNSTGMVPGYICRSRGQKNRFTNSKFHKSSPLKLHGPELL